MYKHEKEKVAAIAIAGLMVIATIVLMAFAISMAHDSAIDRDCVTNLEILEGE